jgi:NitT/TauT family transport system substrate-binding protein
LRISRRRALGLAAAVFAPSLARAEEPAPMLHCLELPTDGAKSVLYAQSAGLFRKAGLQTEVVAMGSGAAIFAAVAGGAAEIGSGSLFPVFEAHARGVPLKIIAPASVYSSAHCDAFLLVKQNAPFRVPADLNGKLYGTDAVKDIGATAMMAWLDAHGGDGRSLRVVELKPSEQLPALDAGRVDAITLKPPYLTVAQESGNYRVFGQPLDAIAPHFLLSCWIAREDFIAKYPDAIDRFSTVLMGAMRWTNANEDKTIGLVAQFTGQDPAIIARGIRSTSASSLTLADVQRPIDFCARYGLIDHAFDAREILAASVPLAAH